MNPAKITFISIFMIIVFFLLFAALYDIARCISEPNSYYHSIVSLNIPGTNKWYFDLFKPNLIVIAFCIPKIYIMKRFSAVGESGSIWNPIFYFAFALVITVGVLSVIEIFDTPDIEIIENV